MTKIIFDIGVDLDSVTYDFDRAVVEVLHTQGEIPKDRMPLPATCWDFWHTQWNLPSYATRLIADANDSGLLYRSGPPIPDAAAGIRTLRAEGHRIHFITARHTWGQPGAVTRGMEASTVRWLRDHGFPYDTLRFDGDKTSVRTDVFLDDLPANFEAVCAAGSHGLLFSAGHNAGYVTDRRVDTWADVLHRVADLRTRTRR